MTLRTNRAHVHPGEDLRGISPLMALRLARYFGCSAELRLGLQQDYELDVARDEAGERIEIEVLPQAS